MDIFNINIHEITKQYLNYIKAMKQLDLGVAGEFLVMAATLVHIKSQMLLPHDDSDEGEEIEEDPRSKLAQKLWEYQRFQEAAKNLYNLPLVGRDLWLRGTRTNFKGSNTTLQETFSLFHLISHYRQAILNTRRTVHRIKGELLSIGDRILQLKDRMQLGRQVAFSQLVDLTGDKSHQINQTLITFLSLLELAKIGLVSLFQSANFEEIHIYTHQPIDSRIIDRIKDYETTKTTDPPTEDYSLTATSLNKRGEEGQNISSLQRPLWEQDPNDKDSFKIQPATNVEILQEEALLTKESNLINKGN